MIDFYFNGIYSHSNTITEVRDPKLVNVAKKAKSGKWWVWFDVTTGYECLIKKI